MNCAGDHQVLSPPENGTLFYNKNPGAVTRPGAALNYDLLYTNYVTAVYLRGVAKLERSETGAERTTPARV